MRARLSPSRTDGRGCFSRNSPYIPNMPASQPRTTMSDTANQASPISTRTENEVEELMAEASDTGVSCAMVAMAAKYAMAYHLHAVAQEVVADYIEKEGNGEDTDLACVIAEGLMESSAILPRIEEFKDLVSGGFDRIQASVREHVQKQAKTLLDEYLKECESERVASQHL